MNILSIETSCDETSVAITQNGKKVLSNVVFSQILYHRPFGGVVPEIASRKHVETLTLILTQALQEANMQPKDIDLVAVTEGPGLIGSLFTGINAANVFAYIHDKPLLGVNHLIGHIYSTQIQYELKFPLLALLISGGHTELLYLTDHFQIQQLGKTLDDAVGEIYDKIAKNLNLSYPGGPIIEKLALQGKDVFSFVRPYLKNKNFDFSFSGLKSNIINFIQRKELTPSLINDICASFQASVFDILIEKTKRVFKRFEVKQLLVVGGVAANRSLKKKLEETFADIEIAIPSKEYCTDQAAMIGIAAYYQNKFQKKAQKKYNLTGNPNLSLCNK